MTESELKVIEKRLIAVERALEALIHREKEAEYASTSDGWY